MWEEGQPFSEVQVEDRERGSWQLTVDSEPQRPVGLLSDGVGHEQIKHAPALRSV